MKKKQKLQEALPSTTGTGTTFPGADKRQGVDRRSTFRDPIQNTLKTMSKPIFLASSGGVWKVDKSPDGTFSLFHGQTKFDSKPASRPMSVDEMEMWYQKNDVITISERRNIAEGLCMKSNSNIVKKDLLRRKISEHFSNNPNSKSVIIKANLGEANTVWKVSKKGNSFNVVEVNTKREEFLIETIGIAREADREPEREDDSKSTDKPEKPSSSEKPNAEKDAGLETGDAVSAPDPEEQEPPAIKTGEEIQLKQLVQKRPIQDISVESDDSGGHITLQLGGLKNPLRIDVSQDGKIKYSLGDLARFLKTGPAAR